MEDGAFSSSTVSVLAADTVISAHLHCGNLKIFNIAIEQMPFILELSSYPSNIVTFRSYVSLPEDNTRGLVKPIDMASRVLSGHFVTTC